MAYSGQVKLATTILKVIMSMKQINNLIVQHVPDIKLSDYQFKRYEVTAFKGLVRVLKLMLYSTSYSHWKAAATVIFDSVRQNFLPREKSIYCFIVSPCWNKNTRIARHFGLRKALNKDFEVSLLNFLFEKDIESETEVIFYGAVELTSANCTDIFNLLSTYENGVLFSSANHHSQLFTLLVEDLANLIEKKPTSSSFNLDIAKAIDLITSKYEDALYPYAREETGEYHLDIFQQRKD